MPGWRLLAQNALFVVLVLALSALVAYVAHTHAWQKDLTQNGRNTLSDSSRALLARLPGAVQVTVFARESDLRGNLRKRAEDFLAPYRYVKPDITVMYVDPVTDPQRMRDANVRTDGEMVVAYNGRTEHLLVNQYDQTSFMNVMQRLAHAGEHVIMTLSGHGERSLKGIANYDLGEFGKQLSAKGYRAQELNLAVAQQVPVNAALLVIAGPRADLQPAETDKIRAYVKGGGNLLWLLDPGPLHGLQPLAEQLGLLLGPGTIVDTAVKPRGGPPVFAVGTSYARHPVSMNMVMNTVFPYARQVGVSGEDGSEWKATPLVEVAQNGWVETGKLDAGVSFDAARDIAGPVVVAYALEREVNDRPQRIVVFGNGDFLSNTYLGNGGNLDLGVNAVNWLSVEDNLISLEPRAARDSELTLTMPKLYFILFTFAIILPVAFALTGLAIWWRRRRA